MKITTANANYKNGDVFECSTFKGLITAATEELRDGCHQESTMGTTGEWRNGLNSHLYHSIVLSVSSNHISYLCLGYTNCTNLGAAVSFPS